MLQVRELEAKIAKGNDTFALLAYFRVMVPRDKLDLQWEAFGAPKRIAERMAAVRVCCCACVWRAAGWVCACDRIRCADGGAA